MILLIHSVIVELISRRQLTFFCIAITLHTNQHQTLLDSFSQIDHNILKLNENLIDTMLFGYLKKKFSVNSEILTTSFSYVLSVKRFDGNLM